MRASVVRTEWRECVFELLERFFLNARYIAPADAAARGKLTLGLRRLVGKPIAERENFPLARREHLLHDSKRSSSESITSMSESDVPSLPVSMHSESETSEAVFFCDRKYIRISFSTHLAAYVASLAPLLASNVEMPLMRPMVPMEMRSS